MAADAAVGRQDRQKARTDVCWRRGAASIRCRGQTGVGRRKASAACTRRIVRAPRRGQAGGEAGRRRGSRGRRRSRSRRARRGPAGNRENSWNQPVASARRPFPGSSVRNPRKGRRCDPANGADARPGVPCRRRPAARPWAGAPPSPPFLPASPASRAAGASRLRSTRYNPRLDTIANVSRAAPPRRGGVSLRATAADRSE